MSSTQKWDSGFAKPPVPLAKNRLVNSGRRLAIGLLLTCSLSACVYVPVVDQPDSTSCKTLTQSMSLKTIEVQGGVNMANGPGCERGECAAVALASIVVVTAGSAIISGSIVLTGNTIHWLEYQGTCSDGYLAKAKRLFLETIGISKQAETASTTQK